MFSDGVEVGSSEVKKCVGSSEVEFLGCKVGSSVVVEFKDTEGDGSDVEVGLDWSTADGASVDVVGTAVVKLVVGSVVVTLPLVGAFVCDIVG